MIVFVHLLNDRSGSPKVLLAAIEAWISRGNTARLFVGSDPAGGCLDAAPIPITRYWYRRGMHRLATLCTYLFSQVSLTIRLLLSRDIPKSAIIYVNTLLPFGAALYGRLTGRRVIYHLHEISIAPAVLRTVLCMIARHTARHLIYVSEFHRSCLRLPSVPSTVIYNSLDPEFARTAAATPYRHRHEGAFRVLMLASLRDYKGVPELMRLAGRFSARADLTFHLVLNDDETAVRRYFSATAAPANVAVHPRTSDTAAHYARASLVLNLSRPDLWIETFGLTILEAMAFGVPVIAPPVGGPLELISDGFDGFLIDSRDGNAVAEKVQSLADDEGLCQRLSVAARLRSARFSREAFAASIGKVLDQYAPNN